MSEKSAVETYRSLRAIIKHSDHDSPIRSILVLDVDRATPSSVAENLARAFATGGDRCVLIEAGDADQQVQQPGLNDLIADPDLELTFAENESGYATIGPGSRGNRDLLAADALSSALHRVQGKFEFVVLTCGSYPRSGDALSIAPHVDAVIVVVSSRVTRRTHAIQARDALQQIGAHVLGTVMVESPRRWL